MVLTASQLPLPRGVGRSEGGLKRFRVGSKRSGAHQMIEPWISTLGHAQIIQSVPRFPRPIAPG